MPRQHCPSCAAQVPVEDGVCFFGHDVEGGSGVVTALREDSTDGADVSAADELDAASPAAGDADAEPVAELDDDYAYLEEPSDPQDEAPVLTPVADWSDEASSGAGHAALEPSGDEVEDLGALGFSVVDPEETEDEPTEASGAGYAFEPVDDEADELLAELGVTAGGDAGLDDEELFAVVEPDPEDEEVTPYAVVEPDPEDQELTPYAVVVPDDGDDDYDDEPGVPADEDDLLAELGVTVVEPEDEDVDDEPAADAETTPGGRVEIEVGGDDDVDVAALEAAIAELEGQGDEPDEPLDDTDGATWAVTEPGAEAEADDEDDEPTVWEVTEPDAEDDDAPVAWEVTEPETEDDDADEPTAWEATEPEAEDDDADEPTAWEVTEPDDLGTAWVADAGDEDAPQAPPVPKAEQALAEGGLNAHRARAEDEVDDLLDDGDFDSDLTWEHDVTDDRPAESPDLEADEDDEPEDAESTVSEFEVPADDAAEDGIWDEVFGDSDDEDEAAEPTGAAVPSLDDWGLEDLDDDDAGEPATAVTDTSAPVEAEDETEEVDTAPAADRRGDDDPDEPTIDTSSFTAHGKKKGGFLSRFFG